MTTTIDIAVSYSQICVFHAHMENPYNDWTNTHVSQGFTWRPISVSFSVLEDAISCEATVHIEPQVTLRPDTIRAIQVPFLVAKNCPVAVGSILNENEVSIAEGEYCLVYETGLKPYEPKEGEELDADTSERQDMWCVLTFVPCENASAEILRQDEQLSPPTPLYMEGWPAYS